MSIENDEEDFTFFKRHTYKAPRSTNITKPFSGSTEIQNNNPAAVLKKRNSIYKADPKDNSGDNIMVTGNNKDNKRVDFLKLNKFEEIKILSNENFNVKNFISEKLK